jgi:ribosome-binding protein aMBF1 (putative translation factor)
MMGKTLKDFKARALARPGVRREYDRLDDEFAFLDEILKARAEAGITQAELAARIGTT